MTSYLTQSFPFTQVEKQFRPFCYYCFFLYRHLPMTFNEYCIRSWWQMMIIKTYFINRTENTDNTARSNANAVYWIYTRTKQKWDLWHHVNKRLDLLIANWTWTVKSGSTLKAKIHPGREFPRFPQWFWTAELRYTDIYKLLQKLWREREQCVMWSSSIFWNSLTDNELETECEDTLTVPRVVLLVSENVFWCSTAMM